MQLYLIEFFIAGFGILLLMWEAFAAPKNKASIAIIGAVGLTAALVWLVLAGSCGCKGALAVPEWLSRFYSFGGHALFFKGFALVSTILVLLMSYEFRGILNRYTSHDNSDKHVGEFYTLPIFACAGLMWMASSTDLVSIFVSLELVTICFYVMVAYMRRNVGSLEAGVKYLILGALSTGFLVYGIAWLYGALNTTDITKFAGNITDSNTLLFGLALVVVSLGFKVGAAPMQLWIPDVYQGAPTPITSYLSVASKAAGFGVAITILHPFLAESSPVREQVAVVLVIMAAATLLYGNLSALAQTNFKRLLAYSSIAHAGFILLAFATGNFVSVQFYLATYLIMTFAGFFILNLVRVQEDSDAISVFDGLGKRNPRLALALTIIMASMAGVPLTAGFYGKFLVFSAAISGGISWLVISIAFIAAAAGFYYYFKVIRAIYWHAPAKDEPLKIPCISMVVIAVLTISLIVFGVWPQPIMDLILSAS